MSRPVCLITGATDGVGKATATALADKGYAVVLAARNTTKAEAVAREITESTGRSVDYIVGDLASLQGTRALADAFKRRHQTLDLLINNAGVVMPTRTVTADGFETTFQVNYLAPFLLTQLLLDELKRSDQGRIINLSSSVHSIGKFELDNLQSTKSYSPMAAYSASKLFVLMFTEELAARLAGTRVTANAVHPGIVRTQMMLRIPGALRIISYLALPFSVGPARGARTTVHVATSPELASVSGRYFRRSKAVATRNKYDTERNRAALWDLSLKAVG